MMQVSVSLILMGFALGAPAQQLQSPKTPPDANVFVFSDGSTMSRADVTRRMLESNQVYPRDSAGNAVDQRSVVVQEDGTVRTSDGRPARLLLVTPDIKPLARSRDRADLVTDGPGSQGAAQPNRSRTSPPGNSGIPIILGGKGKDGAAPVGRIPILD